MRIITKFTKIYMSSIMLGWLYTFFGLTIYLPYLQMRLMKHRVA